MDAEPTISEALVDVENQLRQLERTKAGIDAKIESLRKERDGLRLTQARISGRPLGPTFVAEAKMGGTGTVVPSVSLGGGPQGPTGPRLAATTTATSSAGSTDWSGLDRTSAVHLALKELQKPLDRNDLAKVLAQHGRRDELNDISAALSYLRRKQYAQRQADGRWVLVGAGIAAAVGVGLVAMAAMEAASG